MKKRKLGNSGLEVAPLALGGNVLDGLRMNRHPSDYWTRGFLTGKYRSEKDLANRSRGEFVKKYLNDRGFRILDALDQVAAQYHSVPASCSIWQALNDPGVI